MMIQPQIQQFHAPIPLKQESSESKNREMALQAKKDSENRVAESIGSHVSKSAVSQLTTE